MCRSPLAIQMGALSIQDVKCCFELNERYADVDRRLASAGLYMLVRF